MSRKSLRRFIQYHPGLFQDKTLVLIIHEEPRMNQLQQLSRIIIRYRKVQSSDYLVIQLKKITYNLGINFDEILALNRISQWPRL